MHGHEPPPSWRPARRVPGAERVGGGGEEGSTTVRGRRARRLVTGGISRRGSSPLGRPGRGVRWRDPRAGLGPVTETPRRERGLARNDPDRGRTVGFGALQWDPGRELKVSRRGSALRAREAQPPPPPPPPTHTHLSAAQRQPARPGPACCSDRPADRNPTGSDVALLSDPGGRRLRVALGNGRRVSVVGRLEESRSCIVDRERCHQVAVWNHDPQASQRRQGGGFGDQQISSNSPFQ